MKVILTQDVPGLGNKLETREVADGYAHNYLLPKGLAIRASKGALQQAQRLIAERERKLAKEKALIEATVQNLSGITLQISTRAGQSGRLYGSITPQRIAETLREKHNLEIDRRQIKLVHPIREIGTHSVTVKLGAEASVSLTLEVIEE